jgi:hypothetical protein
MGDAVTRAIERIKTAGRKADREAARSSADPCAHYYYKGMAQGLHEAIRMLEEELAANTGAVG